MALMGFVADAPVKKGFVPDAPVATAAPVSSNPFVRSGQSELSDVGDASDAAITSMLNLPHHVWESLKDLASSATFHGQVDRTPGPAKLSPTTAEDLQPGPMGQAAIGAAKTADTALENASPVAHDLLHNTARVAGDVGDIAAPVSLARAGTGAVADALGAAASAPVDTIDSALSAVGFRNLPRQGEGSGAAKLGAKITGEPPLAQQQTLNNQAVTDTLAKHESGVPQTSDLDYAALAKSRAQGPGKVYNAAEGAMPDSMVHDPELQGALASVGDTTSQLPRSPDVDALKEAMLSQPGMTRAQLFKNIQQARDRASRFYASDQPDAHAIGDAYQGVANAYEDFVGRQLAANPDAPVSLADWQNARMAFAKNYAVQGAVKGTSVNAAKLAAIQAKDPEKLTGGLRLIAEQHNRYPLSTGFGPTTFEPGGVGASGTPQGIVARHVTGPVLGAGIGSLFGMPTVGAASGLLASEGLQSIIRKSLGGNPLKSAALAEAATRDPRLSSFFDQAAVPSQYEKLPPSPGPIVTGRQLDAEPPDHGGDIPLMDLLSHGVEQPPAPGLTAGPMGAPPAEGVPFHVPPESVGQGPLRSGRKITANAPSHIVGLDGEPVETGMTGTDVADPREPSLSDLLEDLRDHPAVMHQNRSLGVSGSPATRLGTTGGVPEDLMTHLENNASGESSASLEAINRTRREQAQGQDRFLIDQDGKMWPIRGVEAADATAPKGSIIVQKGIGGEPYSILDRGGLPRANAHGLLNRALAGGHGMTLMDLLGGSGG